MRLRRWQRWLVEALLFLAAVFALHLWQTRELPAGPAPAFAAVQSDGRSLSLQSALSEANGRPLLLYFWATWCPICKAEEGGISALQGDWPLITVAMQSGDAQAVSRHLRERALPYAAVADADGALAARYAVTGVPTHFIIDARGNIRFREVGYTTAIGLSARLWWAQHFPA